MEEDMELTEKVFAEAPKALAALRKVLEAMPGEQQPPPGADWAKIIGNLFRIAQSYAEDRELFVKTFTREGFDPKEHDDLEVRALAMWQADVEYRVMEKARQGELAVLVKEGMALRKKLLHAAEYLWDGSEKLDKQLAEVRAGRGFMSTADALLALSSLFEKNWEQARNRCTVTRDDLGAAQRIGQGIVRVLSLGEEESDMDRARDLRNRALAHALQGARSIRQAAAFVFRNSPERMKAYPPPLAGRTRRSRKPDAKDPDLSAPDTPAITAA